MFNDCNVLSRDLGHGASWCWSTHQYCYQRSLTDRCISHQRCCGAQQCQMQSV